ncbi:ubiquitin-related domain-containing protein, partial [Mortierella sp. GBAus27b]
MATTFDILIAREPGKTVRISCVDDEPISDLIQRISSELNEDDSKIHERDLFINGIRLKDHWKPLSHFRIFGTCLTYLSLRRSDIMTICVSTLSGKDIYIDCDPLQTIRRLKELVEMKEGITPDVQRFVFLKQLLRDEARTLGSYDIKHQSRMHLVLALRGGF